MERGRLNGYDVEDPARRQFRFEGSRLRTRRCCLGLKPTPYNIGMVVSRNQMSLAKHLHWMFRINFCVLFSLSCMFFFALTLVFAGLIFLAGLIEPQCVRVGGQEFNSSSSAAFADAFLLSWMTFATVGYGNIYPAVASENETPSNCMFVTALCSLESFIGILYTGFCGAILFGKVLRIQSQAQVIFSDPITIRYGSGVESHVEDEKVEYTKTGKRMIPCPVLEFRVVNTLFNDVGGEIIDATLNVVASMDADNVAPQNDNSSLSISNNRDGFNFSSIHSTESQDSSLRGLGNGLLANDNPEAQKKEGPSGRHLKKRIFSKMILETSDHPFFKRVWLARHVLDAHSPVLTPKTRRAIRKCGGYWPEHLNSYQGIHQALAFNQILVSLSGVSNIRACDVYAQKIYDRVDVHVGYEFVNLLYRDGDILKVDTDLINDVREQSGGGGEPLTFAIGEP